MEILTHLFWWMSAEDEVKWASLTLSLSHVFHLSDSTTLQWSDCPRHGLKCRNSSQQLLRSPFHSALYLWNPAAIPKRVLTPERYLSSENPVGSPGEHQTVLRPLTAPRRWGSACKRLLSLLWLFPRQPPLWASPALLCCPLLWRPWAWPLCRFLELVPRCAPSTGDTLKPSDQSLLRPCWSAAAPPLWPKE